MLSYEACAGTRNLENEIFKFAKPIVKTRNNSGESHTHLRVDRSDTQWVHRIFWNGHLACLARKFACSGSSVGYAWRHLNHSTSGGGSLPVALQTTHLAPPRPLLPIDYLVMIVKTRKTI